MASKFIFKPSVTFPVAPVTTCTVICTRAPKALKEIFHKLQNEATLVGLNINEDKTKYMQIKRTGTKDMTHLKI
jgi:hypothetical protein